MSENVVQPDQVEGDRGLPSVNARDSVSSGKKVVGIMFMLLVLLGGAGVIYFTMIKKSKAEAAKPVSDSQLVAPVEENTFSTTPPPPPPEANQAAADQPIALAGQPATPGGQVPAPAGGPGQYQSPQPTQGPAAAPAPPPPRPRLDKGMSDLMVKSDSGAPAGGSPGAGGLVGAVVAAGPQEDSGGLASILKPTQTAQGRAGMLGDRNMIVPKGAMIDCVLQTRIVSTVPGMASCVTTRNVFSDNGRVLLIERGSLVTGEYQSGIQRGQARIFVLWNRVKTPNGVTMDLDSPGADPLGGSGLPGHVNNHFVQRFGAALLLSMVEAGLDSISNQQTGAADSTNNYYGPAAQRTRSLSEKTLDNTINIPPTLYKNQGDRINIFVARDLFFGNVYGLRQNGAL